MTSCSRACRRGWWRLLRIPGLGPKKIKALHDELKIESLADLRAAADSGQIASMKGFGEKTEANILEGIAFVEKSGERILQSTALRLVAPILEQLKSHPRGHPHRGLRQPAAAGGDDRRSGHSVQLAARCRRCSTRLSSCRRSRRCWRTGRPRRACGWPTGCSAICGGSRTRSSRLRCIISPGSKAHNIAMRKRAIARGLSLNEYALSGAKGDVACKTEADVFEALGLGRDPARAAGG